MRSVVRSVIFCFGLLLITAATVNAQQNAMYSQYVFNTLAYNPAYAGSRNVFSATALYRNQWSGIKGAPTTATLTADAPFKEDRIGLGIQLINDELGVTKTTGAALSGAYRTTRNCHLVYRVASVSSLLILLLLILEAVEMILFISKTSTKCFITSGLEFTIQRNACISGFQYSIC